MRILIRQNGEFACAQMRQVTANLWQLARVVLYVGGWDNNISFYLFAIFAKMCYTFI